MSRSCTPSRGRGGKVGTATIAWIAVVAAVLIGGCGAQKNASLTGTSPSGATAQAAQAVASYTAVANVTPPVAATDCAAPSTFTYSGTLSATVPGAVRYQWVYSSGQQGPVQTANFTAAGQQPVTGATVTAAKADGGWGEIKVLSPTAGTSDRAAYKLLCGGTSVGGVTVAAAVAPAARTVNCAPSVPSFTAAGRITVAKAETVTYYWALSNGKESAPATLAFTAPGTKAAAPLTITPSAASGSGEAVLVVTSPVTTASAPAKYTLTCEVPTSQPGSQSSTSPSGSGAVTSGPTNPAPGTTTPGDTPADQPGAPTDSASQPATETTAPASAPTTAQSVPTSDSGGNGASPMSIPAQDTLSDTIELGYTVSNGTQVDGGVAPYTWSITGLPPGVTQEVMGYGSTAGAAIIGTATATGTYPLTVTVTDSEVPAQTLVAHFTFVVLQPSSEVWGIITPGLLTGTVGVPYSADFTATNGVNATFSVSSGELPPGISLQASGVLSGTPTERGTFFVGIIGTNVATGGVKDAGNFNFTINPD